MTFGEDPYTSLTRPNNIRTYMLIDGEFKNTDLIKALKNCVIGVMITRMAKFGTIVTVSNMVGRRTTTEKGLDSVDLSLNA